MKKFLSFLFILFTLNSCATSEKMISEGKIHIEMSKYELRNTLLIAYPGDDPFLPGAGSEYFPSESKEIVWGINRNIYYVFQNVSEPVSCGIILCKLGNGTLASWHINLSRARDSFKEKTVNRSSTTNQSVSTGRVALANRWNDPGYTKAFFPQKESFWILIKDPPSGKAANLYASMACNIAKKEYNEKGFVITIWDFQNTKYGSSPCY
jgi:hypothetical protein